MQWSNGTINEALQAYQANYGILIVYVRHNEEANDDNTKSFNELWGKFDKEILSSVPLTAIQLYKDSEDAHQFAQFFPTPIFPVCYIIGLNGQPLEVITTAEELSLERLNESLRKSVRLYRDQLKEQGIKLRVQPDASQPKPDHSNENSGESEGNEVSLDERVRYARERLEQKRKEDEKKKKEEARNKELERRNEGKLLAESLRSNKEREIKEVAQAIRRQKEEDAIALKRLREQIRKDKEERSARSGVSTEKIREETDGTSQDTPQTSKKPQSDECRIQLRFPNGTTLVKIFPAKSQLKEVITTVKEEGHQQGAFYLVHSYPRRHLLENEKTLFELELVPSAVILVVPDEIRGDQRAVISTGGEYLRILLGFLYAPFFALYTFVTDLFHGAPSSQDNKQSKKRQEGNIGHLHADSSDSSDTEATWNGNSTQQL